MLEFKNNNDVNDVWTVFLASDFRRPKFPSLIGYKLRINGIVYADIDAEFLDAFNKELSWEKLSD